MKYVIGIGGGIGAGKSVVSRILRTWNYPVFDCDSEAKALMDNDGEIKRRLSEEISSEVVADGEIKRALLANIVFADSGKRAILNAIVHQAVRYRFAAWVEAQSSDIVFVEAAILHTSGMIADVDEEWRVTAPEDVRISRVMTRNGVTASQVRERMAAQQADANPAVEPVPVVKIINAGETPLLPQLIAAIRRDRPCCTPRR